MIDDHSKWGPDVKELKRVSEVGRGLRRSFCSSRWSPHAPRRAAQGSEAAAAPWKPSDPATCLDPEAPEDVKAREQTDALREAAKRELTTLERCARDLPASEDAVAQWLLGIGPDGSIGSMRVFGSTLTDCRPLECVRTALVGRRLRVSPSKGASSVSQSVAFRRGSVSEADGTEVGLRLARPDTPKTCADPSVYTTGDPSPAVIQSILRTKHDAFRQCYNSTLARDPKMEGRVTVRFEINADGKVTRARVAENSLPDCDAVHCVRDHFLQILFPKPQGGILTVAYPIRFKPAEAAH